MNWINTYVNNYYDWIKEKTFIQKDKNTDWFLINTPFLGAFNDSIEIYAQKNNENIVLSDNGETLANLELQGLNFQGSKKRKYFLTRILLNYGIKLKDEELIVESNIDKFSQSKHNLLSAIIEVNDLYVLSNQNVSSLFKEDVRNFLDTNDIIYTPDFITRGTTGLEFNFDFQIAKKDSETVIKTFNTINKSNLSTFLFSWSDIKPLREESTNKEVKAVAIINDIEKSVKSEYIDALKSKNANVLLWSEKDNKENQLLVA